MLELTFAFAVIAILAVYLTRFSRGFIRRVRLIRDVKNICQNRRYRFRRVRNPLASLLFVGELPDFIVSGDKEYCVRLITTYKRARFFHFLDERYAASHGKGVIPLPMAKKVEEIRMGEKFHLYPPFVLPKDVEGREDVERILLFNPVPTQITAMVEDANGSGRHMELITSGGQIGSFTVYAGGAFCELLEGKPPVKHVKNQWWGE